LQIVDWQKEICNLQQEPPLDWFEALKSYDPNLPAPVVAAMVARVAQSALGPPLQQISAALGSLEKTRIEDLTGSEAQTLIAILRQTRHRLEVLEGRLDTLWERK